MRELYKFCRASFWLVLLIPTPLLIYSQTKRTLTAVPGTTIDTWVHGYYIS